VLIHSWDISRALGLDEHLPDELVEATYGRTLEYADLIRAGGDLPVPIEVGPQAGRVEAMLALFGRRI
jgi:hypothetical protein